MRFTCIISIFVFSFMKQSWEATDRRQVRLGQPVELGCTISYLEEIVWIRQYPSQVPVVILVAKLEDRGEIVPRYEHDRRFSGVISNQSISLRIEKVTGADCAMYFCAGKEGRILQFGKGITLLEIAPETHHNVTEDDVMKMKTDVTIAPGHSSVSGTLPVYHLYAAVLACGQVGMICAVVVVHLRSRAGQLSE
ncbi:hypothetical protein AGOR_G00192260 [Albula goreensis]|uniref:Immunoglobulin domain-containing protein n=1 Tax=Albula goreensis TaxID=1534307 RepID=A0A8T3CVC8_9TELE|nr:hypothetical protein AGOR_G00192260 [Albula goreensis]